MGTEALRLRITSAMLCYVIIPTEEQNIGTYEFVMLNLRVKLILLFRYTVTIV